MALAGSLPTSSPEYEDAIQNSVIMALRSTSLLDLASLLDQDRINAIQPESLRELLNIVANEDLKSYSHWESSNEEYLRLHGNVMILHLIN